MHVRDSDSASFIELNAYRAQVCLIFKKKKKLQLITLQLLRVL